MRLFDVDDGPDGWSEDMGYGAAHNALPPIFVVTHEAPTEWRLGDRFNFVTDGLPAAIDQARAAAGGNVVVMGGGDVIRQAVAGGLVDELRIHLARCCWATARRCSAPTRHGRCGRSTSSCRRTPPTSPTRWATARDHGPPWVWPASLSRSVVVADQVLGHARRLGAPSTSKVNRIVT